MLSQQTPQGSGSTPPTITATEQQLAAAFTEWDRRFREEPERFESEAARLLKSTPETYGEACAPYLILILAELAAPSISTVKGPMDGINTPQGSGSTPPEVAQQQPRCKTCDGTGRLYYRAPFTQQKALNDCPDCHTPQQHPSRSAPLCVNCKHYLLDGFHRGVCNHPAMPVSLVSGKPQARAESVRSIEPARAEVAGMSETCGAAGLLFAQRDTYVPGEVQP